MQKSFYLDSSPLSNSLATIAWRQSKENWGDFWSSSRVTRGLLLNIFGTGPKIINFT